MSSDARPSLAPLLQMVASALAFSLMGLCVKQVGGRIPAAEVVLARAIVSVALSWWLLRRAGVPPWGQRRGLLVWRGVIGTAALLCVYAALAALPPATRVWCAHEYTEANLRWAAATVDPQDPCAAAIGTRLAAVRQARARGEATIPSSVELELATNLFVRASSAEQLASLRASKDHWAG